MGEKGKEIIEIDVKEVINDLNSAFADEWLSHFQYFLYAQVIKGIDADALKKELEKQSMDELGHAKILSDRIIQLGSRPTVNIMETSTCGFLPPPEDRTDIKSIIKLVLESERCAIDKYNKLAKKYHMKDLVTHEIFEDLLNDEVSDEQDWEDFLPV
ncbi:MAG TPA: ferritin-like domain-containing protein [Candidatus Sulfopaludibacter sp.]|nr:ferritin-like domain-containing protein [Candidatus Sulfopaludibacter sp.]